MVVLDKASTVRVLWAFSRLTDLAQRLYRRANHGRGYKFQSVVARAVPKDVSNIRRLNWPKLIGGGGPGRNRSTSKELILRMCT